MLKEIQAAVRDTKAHEGGVRDECVARTEELVCIHCRQPFVILIRRGTKPLYCSRSECREARASAERERSAMSMRKSAAKERMASLLDSLFENDEVRLRHREILEVGEILAEFKPTQDNPRLELKRFVLACARARGQAPWRRALLELSACAIFLASQYGDGIDKKAMVSK